MNIVLMQFLVLLLPAFSSGSGGKIKIVSSTDEPKSIQIGVCLEKKSEAERLK